MGKFTLCSFANRKIQNSPTNLGEYSHICTECKWFFFLEISDRNCDTKGISSSPDFKFWLRKAWEEKIKEKPTKKCFKRFFPELHAYESIVSFFVNLNLLLDGKTWFGLCTGPKISQVSSWERINFWEMCEQHRVCIFGFCQQRTKTIFPPNWNLYHIYDIKYRYFRIGFQCRLPCRHRSIYASIEIFMCVLNASAKGKG